MKKEKKKNKKLELFTKSIALIALSPKANGLATFTAETRNTRNISEALISELASN